MAILVVLAGFAWHFNYPPRHDALAAVPDTLRAVAAVLVVFGITGFGVTRLLLPEPLRRYEVLWILPAGACATGLVLTVLGFAYVPYAVALALVLAAGVGLSVYAIRRNGWPAFSRRELAWPVYLAVVITCVALLPMLGVQHYAAPVGTGSDAHVAAGTAQFLKHSYPTAINTSQPINRMPPTWQSKYAIYYAFAALSSVSALQTWQVLPVLEAVLLGMAAAGMFLLARDAFGAPRPIALSAMVLAGMDRMALYTVLNPYLNQTWGFFALPFTVVLGWWLVQPGLSRRSRQATLLLLVMFGLVLAFAYPLAVPIPAVPLVVFGWMERRRRIAAGEHVLRLGDLYRGRRSLLWIVPVCAALAVPVIGVAQKVISAGKVLEPGQSLQGWGGDIGHFIAFNEFLSLPNSLIALPLVVVVLYLAYRGLRTQPRALALGLGGLLAIGLLLALYFRQRQFGWYFHFKLLAFIGPLLLLIAAVGAGRMRRAGVACLAGLLALTAGSAFYELKDTGYQLPQATIQLSAWVRALPANASVRLDMWPPLQLWAAYFMDSRKLCSQEPLLDSDYAHVPISRKADYIVATFAVGRPKDAIGPPLKTNLGYSLYRENPNVPGPSYCSKTRQDRIYPPPDQGPS